MFFVHVAKAVDKVLSGVRISEFIDVAVGLDGIAANVNTHAIPPLFFAGSQSFSRLEPGMT